jgi:DNA-binding response OmpR family regulator
LARILVIEDDPSVRKAVRAALQGAGHQVAEEAFGAGGAARVVAFRPDLVLLDLVLPDVGGPQLLVQIRSTPEGSTIPVVAFTGYYPTVEEARRSAPGFTDYLLKPLRGAAVVSAIEDVLRSAAETPEAAE